MGFAAAQQSSSVGDGMTQDPSLAALSAAGVSVWLNDLSRNLLQSGQAAAPDRHEKHCRREH
jgi:hypothetical protein